MRAEKDQKDAEQSRARRNPAGRNKASAAGLWINASYSLCEAKKQRESAFFL